MGERALGLGLRLLGLALAIGPFIIALGMHNWDIKAAVLPSEEEMAEVKNTLSGMFGGQYSQKLFDIQLPQPPYEEETYMIPATFNSPFKFPITITKVSGGFDSYQVRLEDENVYVQELENKTFNVIAENTAGVFSNVFITFEFRGISVQVRMEVGQGGS